MRAKPGATRLGGKIPINTSGGLESRGHPIGTSGLGQINELVTQLRHEAGSRQVENCRLAIAENGGGNLAFEKPPWDCISWRGFRAKLGSGQAHPGCHKDFSNSGSANANVPLWR